MDLSKYRCLKCGASVWKTYTTGWMCEACGCTYACFQGMPKLYFEDDLGRRDRVLRDRFYDGLVGSYYRYLMPFLLLPVRPLRISWHAWLVYFTSLLILAELLRHLVAAFHLVVYERVLTGRSVVAIGLALCVGYFLARHPDFLLLLLLALPVRISLLSSSFRPTRTFADLHAELLGDLRECKQRLQVLDVATGTCNSLYRHGWMTLDAEYTGLDLSATMLRQGREFMGANRVLMDFVLGDAARLPFQAETFDVVLNYGGINAFADPATALAEMARVVRPGGVVVFLDEQLYPGARPIERLYFHAVVSRHNLVHRCPVELIPTSLERVSVHQVYHFYYLCTGVKT